jgi:hypothetical protein
LTGVSGTTGVDDRSGGVVNPELGGAIVTALGAMHSSQWVLILNRLVGMSNGKVRMLD